MTLDNYTPLVVKYRPKNFHELFNQGLIAKILSNAISSNRIYRSYVLNGMHGIGKTTIARIVAYTINCTDRQILNKLVIPCQKCQNCLSVLDGSHPDIIEIDAASKTSIDDIKSLVSSSEYLPLLSKYKIFIIDEVHMLSKSAFNALLKILEEPWSHVIFILATTELHKIPATVISRCQRYDLQRFTSSQISDLLRFITSSENIKIDQKSIDLIAFKANGSARNATVILDQLISMLSLESNIDITYNITSKALCIVSVDVIIEFLEYIINEDAKSAIDQLNNLYLHSINMIHFLEEVTDLLAYLNKKTIIKDYQKEIYESIDQRCKSLIIKANLYQLSILWQIFDSSILAVKNSHNPLIFIEMLIIKALYARSLQNNIDFDNDEGKINCTKNKYKQDLHQIQELNTSSESYKPNPINSKGVISNPEIHKTIDWERIDTNLLYGFLKFLANNNHFDVYYFLLNKVQICQFCDSNIEIFVVKNNVGLKIELEQQLLQYTNKQWNVNVAQKVEIYNLKDLIISKFKQTKIWSKISDVCQDSTISDILFNN
ncbi:MAG: DNA polymerase III subunit gamma/tau [Rickettsiaceae bacterium]